MTMHRIRRIPILPSVAIVATVLLAACAAPTPTTPVPTLPAPTSVPTPAVSPPPFACDEVVGRPGTAPIARISGLAVANEVGIGRITFDFLPSGAAAAVPQFEVRPASPPFAKDPSGLPLDVAGTAFLVIVLRGGTALDEDFKPTFEGPFDVAPGGSPIVDVKRAGDFEAVSSWVVGLAGPSCIRVLPFDGSSRLVIEVREALIAVPTQDPEPAGTPRACPAALIEGILVSDERWGLAIQDPEGLTREVLWPHGYAARREASGLALIDASGSVVAHEGDRVQIGGGETSSDGAWLGCGGIKVVAGA